MFFLYVDESGDPGKPTGYNSSHYILSGLLVDLNNWFKYLENLKTLRRELK